MDFREKRSEAKLIRVGFREAKNETRREKSASESEPFFVLKQFLRQIFFMKLRKIERKREQNSAS